MEKRICIYFGVNQIWFTVRCDVLLVRSTVAKVTADWSSTEVVDVERTTVPDLDTCGPLTTAAAPVKTDCPTYLTLSYCRVSSIQPAGSGCIASVYRDTGGGHSGARGALETIPARTDSVVALITRTIRHLPVVAGETVIILAFCFELKENSHKTSAN